MGADTDTLVYVSPAKICYLKFKVQSDGRSWFVPLFGPLNPSNLQIGCGYFEKVRVFLPAEMQRTETVILNVTQHATWEVPLVHPCICTYSLE